MSSGPEAPKELVEAAERAEEEGEDEQDTKQPMVASREMVLLRVFVVMGGVRTECETAPPTHPTQRACLCV